MLTIADVLSPEDAATLRQRLDGVRFRDGRATAGPSARSVKANRQADPEDPAVPALTAFVRQALERSATLRAYARPVRWSNLIFSRYGPGESYGLHMDDSAMRAADGGMLRTDLSFTLFLSEPDACEGGALLLDGLDGEREVKLPAGALVLYPTGMLHRVTPVTAGERVACVGWIQSLVRRGDQRELLFDLARVRGGLDESGDRLLLDKCLGGLLRMWGEV